MTDRPAYYFAYGSNLHPLRLGRRTPSLRLRGCAWLPGYALRFHKICEADNSAKANAYRTDSPVDGIRGAVYELAADDFPTLDAIEGLGDGGYELRTALVEVADEATHVFFYSVRLDAIDSERRPWAWYRDLVVRGAEWHGMPGDYIDAIRRVAAARDPDAQRRREHDELLAAMPAWRLQDGFELP